MYAKWETEIYVITYVADNNSDGTASSDKKAYKESVTLKGVGFFIRDGYTQDGWSLTPDGEKAYAFGATYADNADLNLYPHWVKDPVVRHFGAVTITEYSDKTVAEIDGEYTGSDTVKIAKDIKVDEVVFNRKFEVGKMSTIMLPFSIDTSKVKGGTFYKFNRVVEENGVRKVKIGYVKTQNLGANTPYLVMPTAETLTFSGKVTFNTDVKPIEVLTNNSWEFVGTKAFKLFDEDPELGNIWGFAGKAQEGVKVGQFVRAGSDVKIKPLRAYLVEHQDVALAKSVGSSLNLVNRDLSNEIDVEIVDENDNVVATGTMDAATGVIRMNSWFDLNGRKLNTKPTTRGTYYYNGKRVIVK